MTADPQPTLPDPRTDDAEEVIDDGHGGRSATAPAEGADDAPNSGSPEG